MLRLLTSFAIQNRGLKNEVKIKWIKPEVLPAYKAERSGDLEPLTDIPDTAFGLDYALSDELKDAPESVRKLFSVGFLGRREHSMLVRQEIMGRVRRHKYDELTAETRIARITAQIRCLQDVLEKCSKNKVAKVAAQELIDKRKKLLKFLRRYDYKKYEWLLEKLNIEYKLHPETLHRLSRRESLRKLTEIHCAEVKEKKLNEYRNLLESQQGPFLIEKLNALKFIRSEQEELKLPITVTEQDIKNVEKLYEEWKVKDEFKRQTKKKKKQVIFD